MTIPTAADLAARSDLLPIDEIADRLSEALQGVLKHSRGATVTLAIKVAHDDKTGAVACSYQVKAKRPVRPNRNEEVIGEEMLVFTLRPDAEGQMELEDALGDTVERLHQNLKRHGASMTVRGPDGRSVTVGAKD